MTSRTRSSRSRLPARVPRRGLGDYAERRRPHRRAARASRIAAAIGIFLLLQAALRQLAAGRAVVPRRCPLALVGGVLAAGRGGATSRSVRWRASWRCSRSACAQRDPADHATTSDLERDEGERLRAGARPARRARAAAPDPDDRGRVRPRASVPFARPRGRRPGYEIVAADGDRDPRRSGHRRPLLILFVLSDPVPAMSRRRRPRPRPSRVVVVTDIEPVVESRARRRRERR